MKDIIHKTEMYKYVAQGVNEIAAIVGRTLGPGGLPILIERSGQALNGEPLGPMITKDGVTVAGECFSTDPRVNLVIQTVKDICSKTNRVAGDGTTTAIVLGQAILQEMLEVLHADNKVNPQQVKRDLDATLQKVMKFLTEMAEHCDTFDKIENVATISANGDAEIGSIIRKAFEAVGLEGIITVDENNSLNHSLDIVDGFQFRRGAEAQDRFFNNAEQTKFEAENCYVVLFDGKLQQASQVLNILTLIYKKCNGKMPPIVFTANEFTAEVLQVLLMARAENGVSVCAVRNPHQTKVTTAMLDDLAVFLGGTRLGNGNRNLETLEWEDLGLANRVVIDKYTTTLFGGAGEETDLLQRIEQLKAQRTLAESPYDAALISDRIASLAEGIAKIGVGGATDFEVKERYHRIEDAVNAARAAISEGIVPGGGSALLRIAYHLEQVDSPPSWGDIIFTRALQAPFKLLMGNIGANEDLIKKTQNKLLLDSEAVYDGANQEVVNAFEKGIFDPVKVTKTALTNACSIAGLLATAGGAILFSREKK